MIKQKTIDEIMETVRVEDVVEDFVNLKRRGVNLIGLCPFHNEKTPSFYVSPSKGIYKCFGCGEGGDALKFVMEHEQLSYPEGLRYLAKKYGIEVEETQVSDEARAERQHQESLFLVNEFAKQFYQEQLLETDRGKSVGLSYFKRRGFREEIIKKFGLGYAPAGKDLFTLTAVQKGYNSDLLKQLGLTSQYGRDFFRDRVMFPIHNLSGKVIGFGGRILIKDVKAPKYVNTPETEVYSKSKVLYGAFYAKQAIRKQDECILVEGYTDVISLHQAEVKNVVASSGTSLTVGQIGLIKRYTENIKILYDGDKAGVKAALRGLGLALEQGMNVKIVLLPEGEDPDSYVQSVGTDAFRNFIDQEARDFIMFQASLLQEEAAGDPVKQSKLIKEIVESISKIPDPIKRSLYVRECANLMGVEEQLLVNEANKAVEARIRKQQQDREREARQRERARRQEAQPPSLPGAPPPPTAGDEPPFPTEEPGGIEDLPFEELPPQKATGPAREKPVGDGFQERDLVRILVTGGDASFDEEDGITVAEYLIANVEDVLDEFDNNQYQRVFQIAMETLADGKAVTPKLFLHHIEDDVQQLAIDLSTSPYEYSENWANKWEIFLTTQKMPDENFAKDSISAMKRFRLRKLNRMIRQNADQLKAVMEKGEGDYMVHLKLDQKLKQLRNELAKELGTVVF
ncbi:MAG: DNA primase [Phaeodactylibacter sp.]|uniref:DNA primase n=1 Tax=Phaeodactylibacter sp. TaxID=1940289 RepID=UPI0032F004DB